MLKLLWHLLVGKACAHAWEKVAERTEQSPLDRATHISAANGIPIEFFQRTYILVLKCSKCGALNKTVRAV